MFKKMTAWVLVAALFVPVWPARAFAASRGPDNDFTELRTQQADGGTYHLLEHTDTGAQVVWLDNGSETREFAVGFRTPPEDSKGANHVLEHSLLCGSEQYPLNDLMHILQNSSVAQEINAYTSEDYTTYVFSTTDEQDFYNLADIYTTCVLFPRLRTEPNIFKQQGIRTEWVTGKAQYNGIVYSELRLRNLDTAQNSLNFVSSQLYENLYGDTSPTFDSGGAIPDILDLTYEDVMRVYDTYYTPSNMLVYTAGEQDIDKTLAMLDKYLDQAGERNRPKIQIDVAPIAPPQLVQEYYVTETTQTVDIGFMAHGPSLLDSKKSEAWGALVTCMQQMLRTQFPDALAYTVGGNAGGVYNVGVILSQVPIAQKDAAATAMQQVLADIAQNGIPSDMLNDALDQQEEAQQFGREEVFTGFAYAEKPLACVGRADVITGLRNDPDYFKTLAAEWMDSSYQTLVVSGNGATQSKTYDPQLTASELERVKRDTEDFNAWLDQPDDPAVLARLPMLDLKDFADDPFSMNQINETVDGVTYYLNEEAQSQTPSFSLYFPVEVKNEDATLWCLLCEFLNDRMQAAGLSGYLGMTSGERYDDPDTLHPALILGGSGEAGKMGETVQALTAWLQSPPLTDTAALRDFLSERKSALRALYSDPYYYEYSMMLQASTQPNRFMDSIPAGFVGASMSYKAFIDTAAANPDGDAALLTSMRTLLDGALQRTGVAAEFTGSRADYSDFRQAAAAYLAALPAGTGASSCQWLPQGWPSALVISTNTQASNHVMLVGAFENKPDNMAVYDVLSAALTAKYMLPELRDRRGAYGAGLRFEPNGVTMVSSGGVSVDEAVAVFRGAAAFLRTLQLAPSELTGFKVSAVSEFDSNAEWERASGLGLARAGRTQADYAAERAAILAVTEDDLKACADELEHMLQQAAVFAQTTKSAAASVQYPFSAYVDADTGKVTPQLRNDIPASSDKTPITRGEVAALLADSLVDQSAAEQPDLSRFTDITPGSTQADALAKLHDRGLLNGYADGSYRPQEKITRAEFCVIASALAKDHSKVGEQSFRDVSDSHWAHDVIAGMAAQGILKGYGDGTFRPEAPITHQQAVLILQRLANE
ncbi:S-layer homology domain-containing protein [Agathobaculum sp. Marseille-P7918]|uniref:S-layer homology domain-containing protein n=1 Tax=Agathobaculum sp. Marseille-P7918 TaxID=2479843 RepID=UPI000F62E913|nr:S-layer homology domain-containing protein [Agathobaculum sp. Marseille-P7918]